MRKLVVNLLVLSALLAAHSFRAEAKNFIHPGGLVAQQDIDRIQYLLYSEQDPIIVAAFNRLQANNHAKDTYNPNPQIRIDRGGADYPDNYSIAMNDVAAAFQNALMWRITGQEKYGNTAVRILNAWARTCKNITGDTNASLASGIYGYEFAQAGELLRGFEGWRVDDFKAYQNWMRNLFYTRAMYFLELRHGRTAQHGDPGAYFSNWGLANVFCVMSIGILCDDVAIYNQGLSFYREDKVGSFTDAPRNPIECLGYNEFLGNLVVWLHPDSRGPYGYLGQMQESGRDQGHALMAAGLAADICQTAWNQGDDLFSYMNNRIAAGFEYIALVNSLSAVTQVNDSVPFIPYKRSGLPTENYTATQNGTTGWGQPRPFWHRVVSHYEAVKGIPMTYSRRMAFNDNNGVDGGGGLYGGNSGGFDHLGFSTLTSYRPSTWYPAPGTFPVSLTASITYDGKTTDKSYIDNVAAGSMITLTPQLPAGTAGGSWLWETGETTRQLTFTVQQSGMYRVVYTAPSGAKSSQVFSVAVWGDCTPDVLTPRITVGENVYVDTIVEVLPYQRFSLSINTPLYNYGSARWSTGNTGFSLTVTNGVRSDSIIWVEHFNPGGYKTRYNFRIKLTYVTPAISVDGANAAAGSKITIQEGQSVELRATTTTGYDGGSFAWSSGHRARNLMILNVQKPKQLQLYYTLTKNGITTIDTLNYSVSIVKNNYQMPDGDYYIRRASDGAMLTNSNLNATDKLKPEFWEVNMPDDSQTWTITKETAADAGGRFKIVSKKDGNYINEKGNFGVNAYYPSWNTYTFHCLEGENVFAVQNGGNSGTRFWNITGDGIEEGTTVQDGYPFIIQPIVSVPPDTANIPGEGVLSYVAPGYSINGGVTQRGSLIVLEPGKNLVLKPVKILGIGNGTWRWSDNSTESSLLLSNVQQGGTYSVVFSYTEDELSHEFPLEYSVILAEDNYQLPEGDYRLGRVSDGTLLTNDGSLNPAFKSQSADTLSQQWTITLDVASNRYKIVSRKDNRFLDEHGRFNGNVYSAAWNTYVFHYQDKGERAFAIQNGGSAGTTYWAVEGNMINDRNRTIREGYPFQLDLVKLAVPTAIDPLSMGTISLYPNPTTEFIHLKLEDCCADNAIFTLYSIDGAKQGNYSFKDSELHVSLADQRPGVYIGIVSVDKGTQMFKIVKQ